MIPLLRPIFQGPSLAALGEALQCTTPWPMDTILLAGLLTSEPMLLDVLRRQAARRGVDPDGDLRPVASAWSLHYLAVLLPPVVAAASLLQHVFPMGGADIGIQFDADGTALRFHLRHLGENACGSDTGARYAPLVWSHLSPLFSAIGALTRLPAKILWSNVVRRLDPILEQAVSLSGGRRSIEADRDWLLHSAAWSDAHAGPEAERPNPLWDDRGGEAPGSPSSGVDHRQCCLYHLLPGEGHCSRCPLRARGHPRKTSSTAKGCEGHPSKVERGNTFA